MNSCIMYTIFMQSFMQSQRISSGVCSSRNLYHSVFIVDSFILLWHLILSFCNQISSFELSQTWYFPQSRRKYFWQQQQQQQQQQHKREPTTRVGPWTLFQYIAFACSRQAAFKKPTLCMPHNTTVEANNKKPTTSSIKYKAVLLPCQ